VNLFKSPVRRTTAILAGAFFGLAGAVAIAAPASAHHPEVNADSACVNENGTWTVKWTVTNSEDDLTADVTGVETEPEGSTFTGIKVTDTLPRSGDGALHGVQTVPADAESAKLTVHAHWKRDGNDINADKSGWTRKPGDKCETDTPPTTPPTTPPAEPGQPEPILSQDCTTITLGLKNPEDGETITLNFKTSKGETRSDVIKPGESKSEKFSAKPGFTVTLSIKAVDGSETVAYKQPEGCDNSGGGGGLPVTGAAAGGIAAGAAGLLVAGGVLFFMARRRKIRFTA
jgi:LPXTG-motif cell wall-anchored protein